MKRDIIFYLKTLGYKYQRSKLLSDIIEGIDMTIPKKYGFIFRKIGDKKIVFCRVYDRYYINSDYYRRHNDGVYRLRRGYFIINDIPSKVRKIRIDKLLK
jgi:hypothetical protein